MKKNTNHNNPWLDIASYSINDAKRFKGREKAIVKFSGIVDRGIMSVLYANSGIGKTSFLNAGIDPLMIQQGYIPVHILFPDEVFSSGIAIENWLMENIKAQLLKEGKEWKSILQLTEEEQGKAKDILSTCSNSLWWMLHTCSLTNQEGEQFYPLLVFDQFEEVFLKVRKFGNTVLENKLFQLIEELSNSSLPPSLGDVSDKLADQDIFLDINHRANYRVIFSLRKEYLSDFDYWTQDRFSISELQQNRMLLLPLTRKQAIRVITEQPAINCEGYVQTLYPITEQIIEKLDPKHRNEIEPFLLSVLCSRLYELALSENKSVLDPVDLQTYNVDTIIRLFYEEKVSEIIANPHHLARFENLLVDEDGVRNRTKTKELQGIGFKENYQEALLKAHLIRIDSFNNDEEKYIELIHDRIADAIMQRRNSKKIKKTRILKILASIVLLLGMVSVTAWLAMYNQTTYVSYMPSKIVVKSTVHCPHNYTDTNIKKVIVKSYLEGNDNESLWLPTFKECSNLEYVEFRDGVYDIPDNMFDGCVSLRRVILKNAQLRTIGKEAFKNCKSLSIIDLSHTIEIGSYAFCQCSSLRAIQLSDSLINIPRNCFCFCESLEHVMLGKGTKNIDSYAFDNCINLHSINIDHVTNIAYRAFLNCHALDTIRFSNTIKEIKLLQFSNISYVKLGDSISKIESNAFYNQRRPITFNTGDNPYYKAYSGFLIDKRDSSIVYAYIEDTKKKFHYLQLPDILDENMSYRYQYGSYRGDTVSICDISRRPTRTIEHLNVYSIKCDDTLKIFNRCTIPKYPYNTLINNYGIRVLDLSACSKVQIEKYAFEGCTSLEYLILPDTIYSIGDEAFKNCTNIKKLDFGNTYIQQGIGYYAFANCSNLSSVIFPKGEPSLKSNIFSNCVIDTIFGYGEFSNAVIHYMQLPDTISEKNLRFLGWCPNTHFIINDSSRFFFDKSCCLWYRNKTSKTVDPYLHGVNASFLAYGLDVTQIEDDTLYEREGLKEINGVLMEEIYVLGLLPGKSYTVPDSAYFDSNLIGERDVLNIKIKDPFFYSKYANFLFPRGKVGGNANIWRLHDDSIMYVSPFCYVNNKYNCAFDPTLLSEIHIPFTSPVFQIAIPDTVMAKIIVYVPYGTVDKFLENDYYKKFKTIKEDNYWHQLWNVFYVYYIEAKMYFRHIMWLLYLLVGGIILFVICLVLASNRQRQQKLTFSKLFGSILATLGFTILTFIIWVSVYYFIWLGLDTFNQILAATCASIASGIFIVCLMFWLNKNNIFDLGGIKKRIQETYLIYFS